MAISFKTIAATVAAAIALATPLAMKSEGEVRTTYLDPIGKPTQCYGHTGPDVKLGQTRTHEGCVAQLKADLDIAAKGVLQCLTREPTAGQLAAFSDFYLNVGPGKKGVKDGFCTLRNGNVPGFVRKFNAGDIAGACRGMDEAGAWTYAGGKQLPGLVTRRANDRQLCEGKT